MSESRDGRFPTQLTFHYIKSNTYRDVQVDGVIGSVRPNGKGIHVSVFSERSPVPQCVTHEIDADGQVGKELARDGKEGVARTLEVGLFLDLDNAKRLVGWLREKIDILEAGQNRTEGSV